MSAEGRAKFALFLLTLLAFGAVVVITLFLLVLVSGKGHAATCPPPDPDARPVVRLAAGEIRALASLAWAEARGEPEPYCSMLAVSSVVINRMQENPKTFGATITQVINKPYQFSVFGRADKNRVKMSRVAEHDDLFVTAMLAAIAAVSGVDNSNRALYFFSGKAPYWSHGMAVTAKRYGHTFLRPRP
jgi:spore germination cell wall hydrolase CwlJ-like protein